MYADSLALWHCRVVGSARLMAVWDFGSDFFYEVLRWIVGELESEFLSSFVISTKRNSGWVANVGVSRCVRRS